MPRPQANTTTSSDRPALGPIGRLGRWTAAHVRIVVVAWVAVAVGLGVLAPRVETALSGGGWGGTGSEAVQARDLIDRNLGGLGSYGQVVVVHSPDRTVADPAFGRVLRRAEARLSRHPALTRPAPPSI